MTQLLPNPALAARVLYCSGLPSFMILRRLFAVLARAALASPRLAQEELEAPVPIPRPESLGRSAVEEPAAPPPPPVPLTTDPQPVTLSARTTDNGPFIPEGVVWRVFG